jgi:hypothetical protein
MRKIRFFSLFILLLLICACSYIPKSDAYRSFYSHLKVNFSDEPMQESPFFLVILVEARHLDYTHPHSFFKTLAKHPSDGSKNGDVGHAWIYLQGIANGETICLEGGHSGELGVLQPRYMEGVFLRYEQGNDDPIAYLWQTQPDGFFQYGSGKHDPTFAAKVDLTEAQFDCILRFVQAYDFTEYAITGNQCSSFAAQAAAFADLHLDCEITMQVDPSLYIGGKRICLWKNPDYSEITFSSPDIFERSLMQAVQEGRAENALCWYRNTHPCKSKWSASDWMFFPKRYLRFKTL